MQRLAGNFLVKRVVMLHVGSGNISELYELPNGQWQFGKGRDARVVTSLDDVQDLDAGTKADVAAWLAQVKARHQTPQPMQAGESANVNSQSPRVRVHQRIDHMSDEVVARLLGSIEQTLGPLDDSLQQASPANHHSAGYGDPDNHAPATTDEPGGFRLPDGAAWADPRNPASGYFTFDSQITDERGQRTKNWHPTPEFLDLTERAERGSSLDTVPLKVHDPVQEEIDAERTKRPELAGTGGTRRSGKRK